MKALRVPPLEAKNSDLLFLGEQAEEESGNEGIWNVFERRYPDLAVAEGKITQMAINTKLINGAGEAEERIQYIFKAEIENADIDGITSKEEAVQAIKREVGPDGLLSTGELRPYFGDNQALTVILKKDAAETLIRKGKIRIGLNRCSVLEKVAVLRCFKCWGYGHMAKECREQTDLSKACRKCGSLEHIANDCRNVTFCINCRKVGHLAGGRNCPEFRKALKKVKMKSKAKWKSSRLEPRPKMRAEGEEEMEL
ncbi:hypothetical protein NQ315_002749 [Exocentrus adspersus]|uniref:CCHC-type domain-containing protein n=1 Tax=Exocentrus adspersus TaxID=1586481 RepID=A0AAV8VJF3_9CUCU|nr:hypothetical protein NQ315_002749 [Exocentrus adspersus]